MVFTHLNWLRNTNSFTPSRGPLARWLRSCMEQTCSHRPCRTCSGTRPSADGSCARSTPRDPCTWARRRWLSTKPARKGDPIQITKLKLESKLYLPWSLHRPFRQRRTHNLRKEGSWMSRQAADEPGTGPKVSNRRRCWIRYRGRTQLFRSFDERIPHRRRGDRHPESQVA